MRLAHRGKGLCWKRWEKDEMGRSEAGTSDSKLRWQNLVVLGSY